MQICNNCRGKAVISNATRWDTFEGLMAKQPLPPAEQKFRARYKKSPSFLSIHMGVRADLLGPVRDLIPVLSHRSCCLTVAGNQRAHTAWQTAASHMLRCASRCCGCAT